MAKMERIREVVTGPLDLEYMRKRADAGWELLAVEWQRPVGGGENRDLAEPEKMFPMDLGLPRTVNI